MNVSTVGASPVRSILYVGRIVLPPGKSFTATSLPGHLLHCYTAGQVRQQCNGRTYQLRAGTVLWYHDDEWVQGAVVQGPVTFYSINFIAPDLPPPAYDARLYPTAGAQLEAAFSTVFEAWEDAALAPQTRLLRMHAALLGILAELTASDPRPIQVNAAAELWWALETRVRRDLTRPVSLTQLESWSGQSAATIARSAQAAVGMPPMRRLKELRLSLARGLVLRSELTFSEIAVRVGYPRLNEFSRDYRRHFGAPPSAERGRAALLDPTP